MLEVGNLPTRSMDRTHFGSWCIVSSPLILGLDLLDKAKVDSVWDIITNPEAIAVNQRCVYCTLYLLCAVLAMHCTRYALHSVGKPVVVLIR
jgi:hypothetical protein